MTVTDWHDAQVIEATTRFGWRGFLIRDGASFRNSAGLEHRMLGSLSDVRVIVDADGRVVLPPITDEMVERAARAMNRARWEFARNPRLPHHDRHLARTALTAALRGEQS